MSFHLCVRSSLMVTKITSKSYDKVSQICISQQPLIRKHSYLGHGYLRASAYIPEVPAQRLMPQGGAGGQNLGQLKKYYTAFSFMLTPS